MAGEYGPCFINDLIVKFKRCLAGISKLGNDTLRRGHQDAFKGALMECKRIAVPNAKENERKLKALERLYCST